jgi:hypothetical protein
MVARRIFGSNRDEVTEHLRKFRKEGDGQGM